MASASPRPNLFSRIVEYAEKTQIEFFLAPRSRYVRALGLSDMRGFTPHLRRVNLYREQLDLQKPENLLKACEKALRFKKDLDPLWILHDLLHIAFYDFASLHLGKSLWVHHDRFLEAHLASELFAVLLLDYHFLIHTPVQGLAVDLKIKNWPAFQKINILLPEIDDPLFCQALADLYLSGTSPISVQEGLHKPSAPYLKWLGHEMRYSSKQRVYVNLWWNDLSNLKTEPTEAQVLNSGVAEGVWSLLQIFLGPEKRFQEHISEVYEQKFLRNLFAQNPKYKIMPENPDFRFTDFNSLENEEFQKSFNHQTEKPNPSGLFLMWQILSFLEPHELKSKEKEALKHLAHLSHTSLDLMGPWQTGVQILKSRAQKIKTQNDKLLRSTFFLP